MKPSWLESMGQMTLADLKSGYSLPWNRTHTITFNKEQQESLETGLSRLASSLKSITDTITGQNRVESVTGQKRTGSVTGQKRMESITGQKRMESQLSDGDFPQWLQ